MKRSTLGEFEHLILLAILHLEDDAYGVSIIDKVEVRTGRDVSQAAAYIALQRLEKKGLVSSTMADPTPERGGRAKRYFELTDGGLARLRESASALFGMWEGLDPTFRGEDS